MKKEIWNGLSDADKKELENEKVLSEIYTRAMVKGFSSDTLAYMTEALDPSELIDLLKELDVKFAKNEEDLILDEDDYNDNIYEIAYFISNKIEENESSLKVDDDKVAEMNDEELEDFLNYTDDLVDILKEFLNKSPIVKKDFLLFCAKKIQELN